MWLRLRRGIIAACENERLEGLVAIVKTLSKEEVVRLQNYMRKVFGTEALQVRTRERANRLR